MIKFSLRKRINLLLKTLESGRKIKLRSGHTLEMAEGHEEPGFAATQTTGEDGITRDIVFQIGSETAWMCLIGHAKEMSHEDVIQLMFSNVVTKPPGVYRKESL